MHKCCNSTVTSVIGVACSCSLFPSLGIAVTFVFCVWP